MRKLLGISLITVVAFVAGRLSQLPPVSAQVKPQPTCGDVNGDGNLNLSDPVYLLNHLFLGGQEPVCPEPPVKGTPGLPDTGQTTCWDRDGIAVMCRRDICAGQDGLYATGCPSEGRFVDNDDGTVTDACTGLMWQQNPADSNGDGLFDEFDEVIWCTALAYCENLTFAGHDDWRLPNVRELQSIVDYGHAAPAIDPIFDTSIAGITPFSLTYWSSTSSTLGSFFAWFVEFDVGDVSQASKDLSVNFFRAVRSGP